MTPQEVATLFRVSTRTVRAWVNDQEIDLSAIRTPSGQIRIRRSDVDALLATAAPNGGAA